MQQYCLALDLKDNDGLIAEYEAYHRAIWPEIIDSIMDAGILKLDIYRVSNRLFMIIETEDDFSFEEKAISDANNPVVQKWEELMWKYQQAIPGTRPGEKWLLMDKIFSL